MAKAIASDAQTHLPLQQAAIVHHRNHAETLSKHM
jgi:hypothetical protein